MGIVEIYTTAGVMTLGVILGGLITWLWSKHYYQKASKELKEEAEKLRNVNNQILLGMEIAGLVTLTRDAKGNPTNFVLKVNVHDAISFMGSTSPTLVQTGNKEEEKK